ncbi:hypothetical protein [Planktotalea sp.]|uniref:hypothetical protein n=1 Tax=Planktotalea sp. TaxID=2029877 RepID=UPI0025F8CD2C|nr:hypothetical protein [Planktotalea sp.]
MAHYINLVLLLINRGFCGTLWDLPKSKPLDLLVKWLVLLGVAILLAYIVDAFCRVFMPSTASRLYKGCVFAPISSILVGLSVDLFLTYAFISQQEVRPEMLELSAFTLAVILLMFGLCAVIATAEPFNEIKNSQITPVISSAPCRGTAGWQSAWTYRKTSRLFISQRRVISSKYEPALKPIAFVFGFLMPWMNWIAQLD